MIQNELYHHGILGQKWGIRRYQNPDGSLTVAGRKRYAKEINRIEQEAIDKHYKNEGRNSVFKSARSSTGKNYDETVKKFHEDLNHDKTYEELERNAHEAEKKRLLAEKDVVDDDFAYDALFQTKEYRKLYTDSVKATENLDNYIDKKIKSYIDTIKDAKIKDLNITENIELAKTFLKTNFKYDLLPAYNGNLTYNPDTYYEDWVDKAEYKKTER